MSFHDLISDGEVLGAFFTLLLIVIPMLAVIAYDKYKAKSRG